jgi:hypothetical protein
MYRICTLVHDIVINIYHRNAAVSQLRHQYRVKEDKTSVWLSSVGI